MNSASTRTFTLIVFGTIGILAASARAQIDVAGAEAQGLTTAVATTMRVRSDESELVVTGKHELLRATLLAFINDQGMESLEISFPEVQWPDGSKSDPRCSSYSGKVINGYYRFIQSNAGVAITASRDLQAAVDEVFKSARITVPDQKRKSEQEGARQPATRPESRPE